MAALQGRRPTPLPPVGLLRVAAFGVAVGCAAGLLAGCLPAGTRGTAGAETTSPGSAAATPMPTATPGPTGPTPRPSFVPPTPTPAPTFLVYTVATGDSLNTIAHKFGTTARSIAYWNRTTYPSLDPESPSYRPNTLRIGWTLLVIPNVIFDEQTLPQPS